MTDRRLCAVPGCVRPSHKRYLLCGMHYRRRWMTGDVGPVEPLINVGSGRCIAPTGYMRVYRPGHPLAQSGGWVLEHRLVAYEAGILPLDGEWHVHHKNHDKLDNRLENLEVLTPSEHGREHRQIAWDRAPAMYESGMSTPEIAAELGTHPGNVSRRLAEMGIRARTAEERYNIDLDSVLGMLRFGVPVNRIASHFGHSRSTIVRIAREHGVALRAGGRPSSDTPTPADFLAVAS